MPYREPIGACKPLFCAKSEGEFPRRANRELNRPNRELNRPNRELNLPDGNWPGFSVWRARPPEAAAVQEQVDAIVRPGVELGLGHRRAEAEGAALRQGDDQLDELLGGGCRAVDRQTAGAR